MWLTVYGLDSFGYVEVQKMAKIDSFRANLVELPVQIGHFLVGTVLDRLRITIILICMQRLSDNYST